MNENSPVFIGYFKLAVLGDDSSDGYPAIINRCFEYCEINGYGCKTQKNCVYNKESRQYIGDCIASGKISLENGQLTVPSQRLLDSFIPEIQEQLVVNTNNDTHIFSLQDIRKIYEIYSEEFDCVYKSFDASWYIHGTKARNEIDWEKVYYYPDPDFRFIFETYEDLELCLFFGVDENQIPEGQRFLFKPEEIISLSKKAKEHWDDRIELITYEEFGKINKIHSKMR